MPIIVAESTAPLLERMATDLARCRDTWARHWLVLPGVGRSEWLQRRWARIAGIAAHSQIVSLRSLIEQAASPDSEPFSRERLVLAVAQALPTLACRLPLPTNTDCSVVDARVLSWSQQVADAIDQGLLCRESNERFAASSFLQELTEQPVVKAALVGHLGTLQASEFRATAERWLEQWGQRGGVPKLWIQLDAGLPHVLLSCLAELTDLIPNQVHLSLLSPSLTFWGDLRTRRHWAEGEDAGPVLTALGRQAQDLHNQAIDRFLSLGSGGEELPSATPKASLLGRLQDVCRNAAAPATKLVLDDEDWSFTVHSCRSPLRELEVCRDRILQALAEDPSLAPDDVLVLLSDPSTQAPLVGAALAPLPVRVLGLGGAAISKVASGLQRLLKTLDGRLGLSDLQTLIEEPLIAERFGFAGNGPDLVDWLEQAHFRWGLDATQRAEVQGEGESRWNLDFALRRLGLGTVVNGQTRDGVVDGAAPLERAAGLSTALLAQLAQFATALYEARQAWVGTASHGGARAAKTLHEWCALLIDWSNRFLGDGDGTVAEHRTQLVNTLIPSLEAAAPAGLLVQSDAVLRLLEAPLEALTGGQGAGNGGLTVAELSHYAGTPARMVLVVGLGTETFPRHEERPAWHPLAQTRKLGDPDRRDADRHALLLSLLGCGERFVLTYPGGSDDDGKERPPSTPLADLLAAVDVVAMNPDGSDPSTTLLLKHGLNGFSPNACAAKTRAVARSFLPSDYAAAATLRKRQREDYPGLWTQRLPPPKRPAPLTVKELSDLLVEPCRIFVRRLGLRLPEELEEPAQEDLLTLDTLARWSLRDRLLQTRLRGGDEETLRVRAMAAGELPRGRYGEALFDKTRKELPAIDEPGLTALTENLQLPLGDRLLVATLPAGFYRSTNGKLVYCSASSRRRNNQLTVKLGLLCLTLAEDARQIETWFSNESKPKTLVCPPREQAEHRLLELCQLHQLAQLLPLPFWSKAYTKMRTVVDRAHKDPRAAVTPEQVLMAAWTDWTDDSSFHGGGKSESRLPATRACFRGLTDPFVWAPALDVDWLPEPGSSLAYRLFSFISTWETAVGDAR